MCCKCYKKSNFKVGERVKTTEARRSALASLSEFCGCISKIDIREKDNPLIWVFNGCETQCIDESWLEHDDCCRHKPLCCPSLAERIFSRKCCCIGCGL